MNPTDAHVQKRRDRSVERVGMAILLEVIFPVGSYRAKIPTPKVNVSTSSLTETAWYIMIAALATKQSK